MKFRDVELLGGRTDIGAAEKELILSGNALRLLGKTVARQPAGAGARV
jgi:hypothetical protein